MSFWMGIGVLCGVAVGLLIWFVFNKANKNAKYDERQVAARGRAYKAGFVTFVFCEVVIFFIELFTEVPLVLFTPGTLQMIVTLLSMLVFVEFSIFSDAYYAATQKFSMSWCIIMLLLAASYVLKFILAEDKGNNVLMLSAGIMIIIAMVSLIVKQKLDKKEQDSE